MFCSGLILFMHVHCCDHPISLTRYALHTEPDSWKEPKPILQREGLSLVLHVCCACLKEYAEKIL